MWKYAFASVVGTSHARSSTPVQDASRVEIITDYNGDEILIAVASDGAGSASQSGRGAALACDLLVADLVSRFAAGGHPGQLAERFIENWIAKFQSRLMEISDAEPSTRLQDFACTLLAAIVGLDEALYFQLGDGAIIESRHDLPGQYSCVCWPQQGEYANATNFLTDADASLKIFCELRAGAVDEVAIFTDGLQSLVLDYRARSAHAPFFASMFAWLQERWTRGGLAHSSESLAAYLNSEKINARTDDDKTLILVTRV